MRCDVHALVALVASLLGAACDVTTCSRTSDCAAGFVCSPAGLCLGPAADAGEPDASSDAGDLDAPSDAGELDAGELDAGDPDAPIDAVDPDAPIDAGDPDAAIDAGTLDAAIDAVGPRPVDPSAGQGGSEPVVTETTP